MQLEYVKIPIEKKGVLSMKNSAQYFWNDLIYFLQANTKNTADYNIAVEFLKRIDEIPNSKIEEFAYHANVTPSTITKFCKKLGFDGFNELKDLLAKLEEEESQIDYIRKNYKKEQYEDAFLIYDSRLTTLFFDNLKKNKNANHLSELINSSTNICVISPDYASNAIVSFAKTCKLEGKNILKLARKTDPDLILELTKNTEVLMIVSSTGKWLAQEKEFLMQLHHTGLTTFVIGANEMPPALAALPNFIPVVISEEASLLNSHYTSSRLYALFFVYLSLQL